jgi:hypothetical protein
LFARIGGLGLSTEKKRAQNPLQLSLALGLPSFCLAQKNAVVVEVQSSTSSA